VTQADTAAPTKSWTGGEWVALLEPSERRFALRIIPEPGWPAPEAAEDRRRTIHLDGSAYLDVNGGNRRLDATELLRAYDEQGEGLFPRLRGTFAILVWEDSRLAALRDPLGTHPLFYAVAGAGLAVSPSLDALIRTDGVSAAVDPMFLAARIIDFPGDPAETFFAEIHRLPAGHLLSAQSSGRRISRFWDPADAADGSDLGHEAAAERFRHTTERAVARCIDGTRAGIFLSGGLDSATVAICTADVSRKTGLPLPLALSFLSPDPRANEEATQRAIAAALGIPQIAMGPRDAIGDEPLLRTALALNKDKPGLLASPLHPIYDELTRAAIRSGCGTLLTGEGGDEWLLPRPEYLADRLLAFDGPSYARLVRAWYRYYPVFSKRDFAYGILWKWGAGAILRAAAGSALRHWRPSTYRTVHRRRLAKGLPAWVVPDPALRRRLADWTEARRPPTAPWRLYEQSRRELLVHPNVAEYCEESFSARRRLGVPVRTPFLDAEIVEFLFNLPENLLLQGGEAKWLARRLVASRVSPSDETWPRTVYGDSFMAGVLRRESTAAWDALGGARVLSELGVVDGPMLDRILYNGLGSSDQLAVSLDLWHVMTLESWLRPRIL
jgi:asparagine synthase (glutamine-hydrolysing)